MIKVGEKLVPCAEQIGRIVHISQNYRYKLYIYISLRISNQLRHVEIRTRLVKQRTEYMATAALVRKVWFSDESRFLLQRADGRARVHRGRNSPTAFTSVMM
jgi:hypothetical protein